MQTSQKYSGVRSRPSLSTSNRDDLQVRNTRESASHDLGVAISQPLIHEKRPAGLVREQRRDGSVFTQDDHLLGDRLGVGRQAKPPRLERIGQHQHFSSHRHGFGCLGGGVATAIVTDKIQRQNAGAGISHFLQAVGNQWVVFVVPVRLDM